MTTHHVSDKLSITVFYDGSRLIRKEWEREWDGTIVPATVKAFKNEKELDASKWAQSLIRRELSLMYL